jgi:hypothetical protein
MEQLKFLRTKTVVNRDFSSAFKRGLAPGSVKENTASEIEVNGLAKKISEN